MATRTERQILEERGKAFQAMTDIKADAEDRAFTSDELTKFDKVDADFKRLTEELNEFRAQKAKVADRMDEIGKIVETRRSPEVETKTVKNDQKRHEEIFEKYIKHGESRLDNEERKFLYEKRGTATQVVGTDALGGYFVPEAWANEIIRGMAYYGGMLEASKILTTAGGGAYHVPTVDDSSNTGALITETTADVVQDFAVGEKILNAYTYTSNIIKLSWELMQDTGYNTVAEVNSIASERLGRIANTHLTTGTGSGQPNGVVTATSAGKTAAANSAITRNEVVDLIHSVDIAYRNKPSSRLMFNDSTLASLKKLTVGSSDDRPLWQPSVREGEPDRIDGVAYIINNDIADIGSSAISMVYGDFSKYCVRLVQGIQLVRLNELYAASRSTGFFAFMRMDGELLDANAIKHLVHPV